MGSYLPPQQLPALRPPADDRLVERGPSAAVETCPFHVFHQARARLRPCNTPFSLHATPDPCGNRRIRMKLQASSIQQCFLLCACLGHAIVPPAGQAFAGRLARRDLEDAQLDGASRACARAPECSPAGRARPAAAATLPTSRMGRGTQPGQFQDRSKKIK